MRIWKRYGYYAFIFLGGGAGLGYLMALLLRQDLENGNILGAFLGFGLLVAGIGLYFLNKKVILPKWEPLADQADEEARRLANRSGVPYPEPQKKPGSKPGNQPGQPDKDEPERSVAPWLPLSFWPYLLMGMGLIGLIVNITRL